MSDLTRLARAAAVYDEWNAGDFQALYALLSPCLRLYQNEADSLRSFKRILLLLKTAVPDLELVQSSGTLCGDRVSDVVVGTGSFTGEVPGGAPTGAPVFFTASCIFEFRRDQIVRVEHCDLLRVWSELMEAVAE